MSWSEQIAIVIPCLNEERMIGSVVTKARHFTSTVIVVNDGSTDQTALQAGQAGARVLNHPASRGKGASLQTGFNEALRLGFDWALAMDGDGQHAPSDIPNFLDAAHRSTAAMLVGNRMNDARSMPFVRRMVNRWMSWSIGQFCGVELPDSQCGFRMVNLHAWKQLHFTAEHFEIESELIVRFIRAGFPVRFVPVETRYGLERSKIHPLSDSIRWFRWWSEIQKEMASAPEPRYETAPQDATA